MSEEASKFWTSKGNVFWVTIALLMLTAQAIAHHEFPTFAPPATPDKPAWIRGSLYAELLVHILFLGAVITGIRNRIPSLKSPSYGDDGTLSLASSGQSSLAATRWGEIIGILFEFAVYLAAWAYMYGIV